MSAVTQAWGDVSVPLHTARLRYFADVGIGETLRRDGAFAVITGALTNIENGIVSDRPDVDPAVAEELVVWLRQRERPASWGAKVAVEDRLHEALVSLGCHEETTGVDMGARLSDLELPTRPRPRLAIDKVLDEDGLRRWGDVAATAGLFDDLDVRKAQEQLYARADLGPDGPLRHWLARRGSEVVGMATGFFHRDAALLEHIGVRPEDRRSGIGTALVAHWLREARASGCEVGVLAPTPDSQRFYERLGFTLTMVRPRHWYYLS